MRHRDASMSLDAMWEHIERLAAQHAIKIDTRIDRPADAFAVPWARIICITPLRSAIGYATALHEIGHIVLGRSHDQEIEREREAWQWARSNAIDWTPAMERCASESLARCQARRKQPASLAPAV
jgi:hypothetical protein